MVKVVDDAMLLPEVVANPKTEVGGYILSRGTALGTIHIGLPRQQDAGVRVGNRSRNRQIWELAGGGGLLRARICDPRQPMSASRNRQTSSSSRPPLSWNY